MEVMFNRLHRDGETLDNSKAERLPTRPHGLAFEDMGSTLKPRNGGMTTQKPKFALADKTSTWQSSQRGGTSQLNRNNSQRNVNGTSNSRGQNAPREIAGPIDVSDSDDEMDLLSSQPDYEDPSTSQKPVQHSRFPSKESSWEIRASRGGPSSRNQTFKATRGSPLKAPYIDPSGKEHDWDPKYPPRTKSVYSNLKFNKKKPQDTEDLACPSTGNDGLKEDEVTVYDAPYDPKNTYSTRRVSPPPPKIKQGLLRDMPMRARNSPPLQETQNGIPKPCPKPRPKHRGRTDLVTESEKPTYRPTTSQVSMSRSVLDMIALDTSTQPKGSQKDKRRSRSRSSSSSMGSSPVGRAKTKTGLEAFPTISPTSSPLPKPRIVGDFPVISPLRGAGVQDKRQRDIPKPKASTSRMPHTFPMLSPISKKIEQPNAKTRIKPGKEKEKEKGKGKEKEKGVSSIFTEDEEENESDFLSFGNKRSKKRGKPEKKLAAFPMATQMLASIGSPTVPTTWVSPSRSAKRSSEGGSGDEHRFKKSRKDRESLLESPTRQPFDNEGDSICLAPHIDPKTLCPYCDMPLPSSPSPLLLRILETTKKKSYEDARPSNPLGRKAPLTVFVTVCQRHRFESQILPEAEKKGWPKTIDWPRVEARIVKMKGYLRALIEDPGDSNAPENDWEVLHTSQKNSKKGAKAKSIFWAELLADIEKKGLKAVSGVQGQFANFEKAQPGYYGELGSVIIHQTLYNMFPPTDMDSAFVSPLTVNEFVQRILVPEVALRLIMEDQVLEGEGGMRKALAILRDSSAYGVAMFPEDGSESGGRRKKGEIDEMGVGDMIVMERARRRRKELEEEEEKDERMILEEQNRELKDLKARKDQQKVNKQTLKAKLKEEEELRMCFTEIKEAAAERPRPRPRSVLKGSSSMNITSTMDINALPQASRSKSRSRSTFSTMDTDTDVSSGTDSLIHVHDDQRRSSPQEIRRSLSASETRNDAYANATRMERAPSRGVASLHLNDESDASTQARAGNRSRASSRAPSRTATTNRTPRTSAKAMPKDDSDSDDAVEFLPNKLSPETPVVNKRMPKLRTVNLMDDSEDTPRANKIASIPPLQRARERREREAQASSQIFGNPKAKSGTVKKPALAQNEKRPIKRTQSVVTASDGADNPFPGEDYDWLLDDLSS